MIENILAACEIEGMLFELREHSLGLNCGMWDYAASFISKFCAYRCIRSNDQCIRRKNSSYVLH